MRVFIWMVVVVGLLGWWIRYLLGEVAFLQDKVAWLKERTQIHEQVNYMKSIADWLIRLETTRPDEVQTWLDWLVFIREIDTTKGDVGHIMANELLKTGKFSRELSKQLNGSSFEPFIELKLAHLGQIISDEEYLGICLSPSLHPNATEFSEWVEEEGEGIVLWEKYCEVMERHAWLISSRYMKEDYT